MIVRVLKTPTTKKLTTKNITVSKTVSGKIMYWGNILLPVVTLGWAALWMLKKKKIAFQKLIDGLLICSVLHAFLAASVPALTNQYYLPLQE